MTNNEIDTILYIQLVIARLGEKELMNWWNTDIAYEMGGGDFLERLLGKTMAPAGKVPKWGGISPSFLSYDLCRKMRDVLVSDDIYSSLDS